MTDTHKTQTIWPDFDVPTVFPNPKNIQIIERNVKGTWIGDFAIPLNNDPTAEKIETTDIPYAIFWIDDPDTTKNHKHIIGVRYDKERGQVYIGNATNLDKTPLIALQGEDGAQYVACYPHHYREESNTGHFIDAGQGYFRSNTSVIQYIPNIEQLAKASKTIPAKYRYSADRYKYAKIAPTM